MSCAKSTLEVISLLLTMSSCVELMILKIAIITPTTGVDTGGGGGVTGVAIPPIDLKNILLILPLHTHGAKFC